MKKSEKGCVCVYRCSGVCAESRIALGIPGLFWLVRLQLLHSMGEEGPGQSKTTKFLLFVCLSFSPSLFLHSCLRRDGSRPASCIIKPFIYTLLTDATSSLGRGNTVCFSNLREKIEFHGRVICGSKALLMLDRSYEVEESECIRATLSKGRNLKTWTIEENSIEIKRECRFGRTQSTAT